MTAESDAVHGKAIHEAIQLLNRALLDAGRAGLTVEVDMTRCAEFGGGQYDIATVKVERRIRVYDYQRNR